MRCLITSVAAIALVASAAQAQVNGKGGHDGNPGHGEGPSASAKRGGGGHGGGKPDNAPRGPGGGGGNDHRNGGPGNGGGQVRADRDDDNGPAVNHGNHGKGPPRADVDDRGRGHDSRMVVLEDRGRGHDDVRRVVNFASVPSRGLIAGCPPGLAKKRNGCQPPGQARHNTWERYDRPDFWGLRLGDGRYRYDDGYLVQLGPDGRIGSYIPLLGGALAIGNAWPTFYEPVALPTYYESYYGLGQYDSYRYADNVIYRVDPETSAISSIAALLTGDDFTVGQAMPVGYEVYNVPYAYRTQYQDRSDALYRYSDGYVYQVDPTTRLIAAAIELVTT